MAKGATPKGQLERDIDACFKLQTQRKELEAQEKRLRAAIQDQMERADLDRVRTPGGAEALVIAKTKTIWDAEKLLTVLKRNQVDELMPRTPAGAKLRKALESGAVPALGEACTTESGPVLKIDKAKE